MKLRQVTKEKLKFHCTATDWPSVMDKNGRTYPQKVHLQHLHEITQLQRLTGIPQISNSADAKSQNARRTPQVTSYNASRVTFNIHTRNLGLCGLRGSVVIEMLLQVQASIGQACRIGTQ
jgi:hypothetical protein